MEETLRHFGFPRLLAVWNQAVLKGCMGEPWGQDKPAVSFPWLLFWSHHLITSPIRLMDKWIKQLSILPVTLLKIMGWSCSTSELQFVQSHYKCSLLATRVWSIPAILCLRRNNFTNSASALHRLRHNVFLHVWTRAEPLPADSSQPILELCPKCWKHLFWLLIKSVGGGGMKPFWKHEGKMPWDQCHIKLHHITLLARHSGTVPNSKECKVFSTPSH